jgi:hypothetical protein
MAKSILSTQGAVFLGTNVAGMYVLSITLIDGETDPGNRLSGVVCTQAVMYFRRYRRDKTSIKLMVSSFPEK